MMFFFDILMFSNVTFGVWGAEFSGFSLKYNFHGIQLCAIVQILDLNTPDIYYYCYCSKAL